MKARKLKTPPRLKKISGKATSNRVAGVLLHPTSLPGPFATGDIGRAAHEFVETLARSGQGLWQMLPINPVDSHDSPYASVSSFAAETMLISPESLVDAGLLLTGELDQWRSPLRSKADYERGRSIRVHALSLAWSRAAKLHSWQRKCAAFWASQRWWLEDYALFIALSGFFDTDDWTSWPRPFRTRDKATMRNATEKHSEAIARTVFEQLIFAEQWDALHKKARSFGVQLVGDIPIFINHRSVDVWAHQSDFLLKADGKPAFVSGVPPDYFVKDGQLWGHALYDWPSMQKNGFSWWVSRFRRCHDLFDVIRIDHFIGFHRFWKIPAAANNARKGTWVIAPGHALFKQVRKSLGVFPIIAEDLGLVTPEVHALREAFGFPGMRVLQFGMSASSDAAWHRMQGITLDSVVYPGTHDNNTVAGWIDELEANARMSDEQAKKTLEVIDTLTDSRAVDRKLRHRAFLKLAYQSPASIALVQLQDVLGLDGESRMNRPGIPDGNWTWRWIPQKSDEPHFVFLRNLSGLSGRCQL